MFLITLIQRDMIKYSQRVLYVSWQTFYILFSEIWRLKLRLTTEKTVNDLNTQRHLNNIPHFVFVKLFCNQARFREKKCQPVQIYDGGVSHPRHRERVF